VQFLWGAVYMNCNMEATRPHTSHAMLSFSQLSKTATIHTLTITILSLKFEVLAVVNINITSLLGSDAV
jgi:hypothetical protein